MTEIELRANALLQELQAQRDILGARAANFAADCAVLKQRCADLEAAKEPANPT